MKKLIKKYETFIKYILSAGISFAMDYLLFSLFSYLLKVPMGKKGIIAGQYSARAISSYVNYHLNRNQVFKNSENGEKVDTKSLVQFVGLVIIQATISAFAIYTINKYSGIDEKIIYIPVQCVLFIINYFIQKLFIFKKKA